MVQSRHDAQPCACCPPRERSERVAPRVAPAAQPAPPARRGDDGVWRLLQPAARRAPAAASSTCHVTRSSHKCCCGLCRLVRCLAPVRRHCAAQYKLLPRHDALLRGSDRCHAPLRAAACLWILLCLTICCVCLHFVSLLLFFVTVLYFPSML